MMVLVVLSAVCLAGGVVKGDAIWTAYNDCIRDDEDSTPANTTDWTIYGSFLNHNTGKLKDFATGSEVDMPTVTFRTNPAAPTRTDDYGRPFAPGTGAYEVFHGKVDFSGANIQHSSSNGWWIEIDFNDLDPTKTYTFVGSAVRVYEDGINYRRSLFTIDAEDYVNNSGYHPSVGDPSWIGTDKTKFLAVGNETWGVVVRWDDIVPWPDGDFTVRAEADSSPGSHGRQGYPFNGFMLQQIGPIGNQPPTVKAGSDQEIRLPNNSIDLDGSVKDDGLGEPNDFLEFMWSKVSGPGTVAFEPSAFVTNPTVTFESVRHGDYVLRLDANDGELSFFDEVTITVLESICPIGDLNGDCIVNSQDVDTLAGQWLLSSGSADLNGKNGVEMVDFAWLARNWYENRQTGSLKVTIEPKGARDAEAQWRVYGGDWRDSGDIQSDLSVGIHTVEFKTIFGWDTPNNQQKQVDYAQTAETSGTYIQQTGTLQVTISPQEAIDAGAKWSVDGGPWRDSGDSGDIELSVDSHTVEFMAITDWIKPGTREVQVNNNLTTNIDVIYKELGEAPIVINEFMAVNSSVPEINPLNIYTEVNGRDMHPDWIELHSMDSVNTIDLEGWYLTNDEDELTKWRFPGGVTISPDGYLVLFASSKTKEDYPTNYPYFDTNGALHTNFALGREGYLALVKPDGLTMVHEYAPQYPEQRGFVSYGIGSGGACGYLKTPTPGNRGSDDKWSGAANSAIYDDVVADTKFSHDRGFYDNDENFDLTISTTTPGATIHYTTNGSTPTETHGDEYINPIPIGKTTPLKAMAFKAGWLSTNVDAQTYIFLDKVLQQPSNPPGFPYYWALGTTSDKIADYEMDPEIVDNPQYHDRLLEGLRAIPTLSLALSPEDLFGTSGLYWNRDTRERPASAELIYGDGVTEGFHVNCGARIQGGASRNTPQSPKHAFSLRFRGGYGPSRLEFALFEGSSNESFDTLQLRAGYNNTWIHRDSGQRRRMQQFRDQWIRDALLDMGQDSAGQGIFVHLYLNGLYWGVYNVHERAVASHYADYYGGYQENYDAINSGVATDGTAASWDSLRSFVSNAVSGGISLSEFQQIQEKLDVVNLIDYIIVNFWADMGDWDNHNWRSAGGGMFDAPWRMFSWDAERGLENVGENLTGKRTGHPTALFQDIRNSAEFRVMVGDRLHKHFFNGGTFYVDWDNRYWNPAHPEYNRPAALWMERSSELDLAIIGESARWGDYRRDVTGHESSQIYTRDNQWITERDNLLNNYLPQRSKNVLGYFKSASDHLYPAVDAPVFNIGGVYQHGGYVSLDENTLTLNNPYGSGTIYYTTDGNDPRLPGGSTNPDAASYGSAIPLEASTHLKARTKSGSTWSALNEAVFAVGPVAKGLRITEIMYHPQNTGDPDDPNREFIELKNIGQTDLNLSLVGFTNGVDFTFPNRLLAAGKFVLVVKDQTAFAAKYPGLSELTAGEYTGSLDNAGERIRLQDALGQTIHDFRYKDGWYGVTDGGGFSLTHRDPCNIDPCDWGLKSSWGAGTYRGGSPGEDDTGPQVGDIVINEILAHSDIEPYDWIELYNPTDKAIDIGGWFLSDSDSSEPNLMKYQIPANTIIGSDQYKVFTEEQFGDQNDPNCHVEFALSENGESLYLSSGISGELTLTGFRDKREFRASDPDVAFGLYTKSDLAALAGDPTDFTAMSQNTKGLPNIYPPVVGPVVIAEIMYHPEASDPELEYIKLVNILGPSVPIPLQRYYPDDDIYVQWKFTDGIRYTFPPDKSIDDYLYVVYDKAEFSTAYPGVPSGKIFGPFENDDEGEHTKLSNSGEDLELSKPGDKDEQTDERFYILVDRVEYSDGGHERTGYIDPWPTKPDGGGSALSRIDLDKYGNDPNNWEAANPSPGG